MIEDYKNELNITKKLFDLWKNNNNFNNNEDKKYEIKEINA